MRKDLTIEEVMEVMDGATVLIAKMDGFYGGSKKLVFNVLANEYEATKNGTYVAGGQALEEILEIYNDIELPRKR